MCMRLLFVFVLVSSILMLPSGGMCGNVWKCDEIKEKEWSLNRLYQMSWFFYDTPTRNLFPFLNSWVLSAEPKVTNIL